MQVMKIKARKLALNKQTIRNLSSDRLQAVNGGLQRNSTEESFCYSQCPNPTDCHKTDPGWGCGPL